MSFFLETTEMDLGDTAVENIFINDYMPTANGTYVKVYLLGFKYAVDREKRMEVDNEVIAKHLQIPLADVLGAWDFWSDKGIIEKISLEGEGDYNYGVKFLSLKQLYIQNTFGNSSGTRGRALGQEDQLMSGNSKELKRMFAQIEEVMERPLGIKEREDILDWIGEFKMEPKVISSAFTLIKDQKSKKNSSWVSLNYIKGTLRNWYDAGVTNMEDLMSYWENQSERQFEYREILKNIGQYTNPSQGQMEIIDRWLDEYGFSMDLIGQACKKTANTSNPNLRYVDSIMTNWHKEGVRTLEDARLADEKYEKSKEVKKTSGPVSRPKHKVSNRFHNFHQRTDGYSEEELEDVARRKREEFIKKTKGGA